MSIILWLIVGAIAGWIAIIITKRDSQMGWASNIVVGILGSVLGGALYSLLFRGTLDITTAFLSFRPVSLLISILGAVLLISILKYFRKDNLL